MISDFLSKKPWPIFLTFFLLVACPGGKDDTSKVASSGDGAQKTEEAPPSNLDALGKYLAKITEEGVTIDRPTLDKLFSETVTADPGSINYVFQLEQFFLKSNAPFKDKIEGLKAKNCSVVNSFANLFTSILAIPAEARNFSPPQKTKGALDAVLCSLWIPQAHATEAVKVNINPALFFTPLVTFYNDVDAFLADAKPLRDKLIEYWSFFGVTATVSAVDNADVDAFQETVSKMPAKFVYKDGVDIADTGRIREKLGELFALTNVGFDNKNYVWWRLYDTSFVKNNVSILFFGPALCSDNLQGGLVFGLASDYTAQGFYPKYIQLNTVDEVSKEAASKEHHFPVHDLILLNQ